MTQNGQPDNPRSARYILKDFVNGRLLYCVAPPTLQQKQFHTFPPRRRVLSTDKHIPPRTVRVNKGNRITSDDFDRAFFQEKVSSVHVKGVLGRRHASQHSSMYVTKYSFYIAQLFILTFCVTFEFYSYLYINYFIVSVS